MRRQEGARIHIPPDELRIDEQRFSRVAIHALHLERRGGRNSDSPEYSRLLVELDDGRTEFALRLPEHDQGAALLAFLDQRLSLPAPSEPVELRQAT